MSNKATNKKTRVSSVTHKPRDFSWIKSDTSILYMVRREFLDELINKTDISPVEAAQFFWDFLDILISMHIEDSFKKDKGDKGFHTEYADKIKSIFKEFPGGNKKELPIMFNYTVKPYLNLVQINKCLKELHIDDSSIENIISVLKPIPIEHYLIPGENRLNDRMTQVTKGIFAEANQKIRTLSPLLKRLTNLSQDKTYCHLEPLEQTINILNYDIEMLQWIVKIRQASDRHNLSIYHMDKDLRKSPQKHKYWNTVVSHAIRQLNDYCHSVECDEKCRKTHQKAINKAAELLTILYPSIWKEDIETIAKRIKQKDYRGMDSVYFFGDTCNP